MSAQTRYEREYGTTGSYHEQGTAADERAARQAAFRICVTEDRMTANVLIGLAVCACCLALAVFLNVVPIPVWITK